MSISIFTNLLSGSTGLDKSVVMTANHLHRRGYPISIMNFVGTGAGTSHIMPRWPLDIGIPVRALQTVPADRGRQLHRNMLAAIDDRIPNLSYRFTPNSLLVLRELNAQLGADDAIVFTHPLQAMVFADAIGDDERRCRTVMQLHGDYRARHPELYPMLLDARHVVDDLQTVSHGLERDFTDHWAHERIHWIPNIHEPVVIREPAASGRVDVVLVGSFQEAKNQLDAVRMMERLDDPNIKLTFWGNHDNPYGNYVEEYVSRVGVADRVAFGGMGSEQDIYGSADIVIIPSRSEGFGYPLVEAASHGIPVVAFDYRYGPRDVIDDGDNGFIVPDGDVDALAERVGQLAADTDLRTRLGSAAADRFHERFAPDQVVDRYDALLGRYAGGSVPVEAEVVGDDPVIEGSLQVRPVTVKGRPVMFLLEFRSTQRLRAFQVESSVRTRRVRAWRTGSRYVLPVLASDPGRRVHRARQRVVSYETDDAEAGRFYLGNTTNRRMFEVGRHLLRRPTVTVPSNLDDIGALRPDCSQLELDATFEVDTNKLHLTRHARRPVIGGTDSFGAPVNADGGVVVENSVDVRVPSTIVTGEHDGIDVFDATGTRSFVSPLSYGELFDQLLAVERSEGLFDYELSNGVRPWELYRGALVATMSEALGLWGPHFGASSGLTWDVYFGSKQLQKAPTARRVLFEFPRKPDAIDARTKALQSSDSMIIEYPQPYGYAAGVYTDSNRFPIREYNLWRRQNPIDVSDVCDPRPIERVLTEAFGFPISIGASFEFRVQKFIQEREFWTPVFEAVRPEEVIIPSSHWSAGICEAARRAGAVPADLQYALTSPLHPSYWFGARPGYGATRLYAWADFWTDRTNAYDETVIQPRAIDLDPAGSEADIYDVCVVSQPRVSRRIFAFVTELAERRPDLRICLAPHPDEREAFAERVAALGSRPNMSIAPSTTLDAMRRATVSVGAYSTSMYEAAALGKPVYVLPVPGHEIVLPDVESGLFRVVTGVDDLEPFPVAELRSELF